MRIIAGQRRGHKIDGPDRASTRPTSDLVREAIFDILGDAVAGRTVVDLFAGTGALGLEALSRGAARAVLVEQNRANVGTIRRNVATLRYEDRATVLHLDAFRWARTFRPDAAEPVVVLVDPPGREYENHPGRVARLLAGLAARLPAGSVLVVEASSDVPAEATVPDPEGWDLRRYGQTRVAFRTVGGPVGGEEAAGPAEGDDDDA